MKREDRYPNTSTFTFYNANPKKRYTGDCSVRAICTALDKSYNEVVMEMAEMMCETGYSFASDKLIEKYLASKGWVKNKQPKHSDGTKYTGKEFARRWSSGTYICNIGGHHIVCIKEGKVLDIWDSTNKCIGNYYELGKCQKH